ncbi:basic secretory protein-like protein [Exilibacterium tricleocarpae]|nr:basic secretory protein-like protein [Exilibacterium tricleocarpae]
MRQPFFSPVATAIVFCGLLVSGSAAAADVDQPLFSPLPDKLQSTAAVALSRTVEDREVDHQVLRTVNAALVSEEQGSILLNLDGGIDLRAVRRNAYASGTGAVVWRGSIAAGQGKMTAAGGGESSASNVRKPSVSNVGKPSAGSLKKPSASNTESVADSVIIVRRGNEITATIHYADRLFKVEPLADGAHVIKEINPDALPEDHPPAVDGDTSLVDEQMLEQLAVTAAADPRADTAVIDLLVVYTPAVRNNIAGTIDLAIAETNAGYADSDINARVRLAHMAQVNYRESGDMRTDLSRFAGRRDGYMDEVHSLLEQRSADVAILITNGGGYCGIARGIGSNVNSAYAIVAKNCATGNYTFAHEIGHLQGARHNPEQDSSRSPYPFGHGYANRSGGWRTVMSYNIQGCCRRRNFWSHPGKTFRGAPRGTAAWHDNHRVLNITAPIMAGFRNGVGPVVTGTFALQALHSGKCLDVADRSPSRGGNIVQWDCNQGENQQWELRDRGNNQIDLQARHSSQCLAVRPGSGDRSDGQNIEQQSCDGSTGRRFGIIDYGNNIVALQNVGSGKCVDVEGARTGDGANILQWGCHGNSNQKFRLLPVTEGQNQAPVARVNGPYSGTVDSVVRFRSTGTSDPDGSIISYQWDFGDGNTSDDANPEHTYTTKGTYTVALTVLDDSGASKRATTEVTITDGVVCFYQHSQYRGASFCRGAGDYTSMPSGWNDVVSSVRVQSGYRVELFRHINFGGTVHGLNRDITNLTTLGFNDTLSSFRISTAATGWEAVLKPSIDYRPDNSSGARLFRELVPDVDGYIHRIAAEVGPLLYETPAAVPNFSELELRIENWDNNRDGIAWKAGRPPRITVNINAYYLDRLRSANRDVLDEVTGILYHEMTHAYQHASGAASSAVEGLADTVRHLAGYAPLSQRRSGGHWTSGYKTTGFFLAWLQEEAGFSNFVRDFNQQANPDNPNNWTWESAIRNTTGQDINTLWNEYQVWIR